MEELNVLYEDNHIIVVVKPQNIPTQEDESKDKDMLTMVKEYIKEKENKPGNVYVGLVHRLDRPTGGVMVFIMYSGAICEVGVLESHFACLLIHKLNEGFFASCDILGKTERRDSVRFEHKRVDHILNGKLILHIKIARKLFADLLIYQFAGDGNLVVY